MAAVDGDLGAGHEAAGVRGEQQQRSVEFRHLPEAPLRHEAYRLRSGSWFASEGVSFEQVMLERFGDTVGRIAAAPGASSAEEAASAR